jgi:hypothetical protein
MDQAQSRQASDAERKLHFVALAGGILLFPMNVLGLYDHFIAPVAISHALPWDVLLWLGGCLMAAAWLVAWTVVAARRLAKPSLLVAIETAILGGSIAYPLAMMMSS